MVWINREFEHVVREIARQRPALVLAGARQTGKTSLLRHVFPTHTFVSLDLPSEAALAEEQPAEFLRRYPAPMIVDEVQYAPGLFRHLKHAIDEDRQARGKYLLTGSQKFVLMRSISDSLAGRAAILELGTLSLREVRQACIGVDAIEHLLRGGYPELWADRSIDAVSFYRSYVATYLERDLRAILRVANLRDFERFLRACALRSGQLVNKADLARDIGISGSTANEWLNALQASGQLALLEPWSAGGSRSITKSPKLFFCDSGLLCFLLNIRTLDDLRSSPFRGAVFETAVYCELRKHLELRQELESLFFYRDRGREVDFLIHRGGRFELLECKWTELPTPADVASMAQVAELLGAERILGRTLICRAERPFPMPGGVRVTNLQTLAV